jgi:hypothetical protein
METKKTTNLSKTQLNELSRPELLKLFEEHQVCISPRANKSEMVQKLLELFKKLKEEVIHIFIDQSREKKNERKQNKRTKPLQKPQLPTIKNCLRKLKPATPNLE